MRKDRLTSSASAWLRRKLRLASPIGTVEHGGRVVWKFTGKPRVKMGKKRLQM